MNRITANEAALIQRNVIALAAQVGMCQRGLARLSDLSRGDPELVTLNARIRDLAAMAAALDLAPVQVAA